MRSCHCVYCVYSACTSWNPLHKCKVSTNYINMVLFDSFSGTDQGTVEPQERISIFFTRRTCKVFNRLARALRDEHYLQTSLHSIELIKIYKTFFRWVSTQKEAKIWPLKVLTFLRISRDFHTDYPLYGHTKSWNTKKRQNFKWSYLGFLLS